jgi:hypothetical protein
MAVVVMVPMNMSMPEIKMTFNMRYEVLMAVSIQITVFWDVTECSFATNFPLEPAASMFGEDYTANGGSRFL